MQILDRLHTIDTDGQSRMKIYQISCWHCCFSNSRFFSFLEKAASVVKNHCIPKSFFSTFYYYYIVKLFLITNFCTVRKCLNLTILSIIITLSFPSIIWWIKGRTGKTGNSLALIDLCVTHSSIRDAKIAASERVKSGVTGEQLWLKINEPTEKDKGKYTMDIFDGKDGVKRVFDLTGKGEWNL